MTEARDRTARRLLDSSARRSYDPDVDIDWDANLPADKYFMPPRWISLYGTELWHGMSQELRRELGRQEIISMTSFGIVSEVALMQLLLKAVAQDDPASAHARYALTEVADECRHSAMFGRAIAMYGGRPYLPPRRLRRIAAVAVPLIPIGVGSAAATLMVEELYDTMQRATMVDEDMQPGIRMVNRIHVVEESRHIAFAREEIRRLAPSLRWPKLVANRIFIGLLAAALPRVLVDPRAYKAVGLPARQARAAALANPEYQRFVRWLAEGFVAFLDQHGLIGWPALPLWRRSFMLSAERETR